MRKSVIISVMFVLLVIINQAYSLKITAFEYQGLGETKTNTVLHFFKEYSPEKEWNEAELDKSLRRTEERLTITGWFKNVSLSNISTNAGEAVILFDVAERIPYTAWLGDLFIGLTKFNLWGKGKVVSFEVGPDRQIVFIQDKMIAFSPLSYSFELGAKEYYWLSRTNSMYDTEKVLQRVVNADLSYELFPDFKISAHFGTTKFEDLTNKLKIDSYFETALSVKYDTTAGFPVVNKGIRTTWDLYYVFGPNIFKTELTAQFYQRMKRWIHFSQRIHFGYITPQMTMPSYHMFSLRHIDGLHTINHNLDGMIGNIVWDAHIEARWAFWDIIPFLFIFDLQIEAVAFVEMGEARMDVASLGSPHFVYGGGLRFYLNTFVVRAEMGIDETGESSVTSSFSAAF